MTAPREGLTRVALDLCEHHLNGCTDHPNASGHGCKTEGCGMYWQRIPYEGLREHVKVMWPAPLMACVEALRDAVRSTVTHIGYSPEQVYTPHVYVATHKRWLAALAALDHYLEGEPAAQEER